jgi:hypothetical protein
MIKINYNNIIFHSKMYSSNIVLILREYIVNKLIIHPFKINNFINNSYKISKYNIK